MPTRALSSVLLALLLAACAADRTAILVEVTSADLNAPGDVDELHFEAVSEHGARIDSRHAIQETWPHSLTIVPPESERMGALTITVTGLKAGAPVVRRVVSTSFQRDTTRRVVVTFTRDCVGVICAEGIDCAAGRCVGGGDADGGVTDDAGTDAGMVDASTEDDDASTPDASTDDDASTPDAGTPDAGTDAGGGDDPFLCNSDACIGRVVISEVSPRASSSAGGDEFIELYNPGDVPVDVSGMQIQYVSSSGSESSRGTIMSGTVIAPHGYLLLVSSGYTGPVARDPVMTPWTTGIADSATIVLVVGAGTRVDMLGYGSAMLSETAPATSDLGSSPVSYERKAHATASRDSMSAGGADEHAGNGHDTDDNAADFVVRAVRDPQSSASPREP